MTISVCAVPVCLAGFGSLSARGPTFSTEMSQLPESRLSHWCMSPGCELCQSVSFDMPVLSRRMSRSGCVVVVTSGGSIVRKLATEGAAMTEAERSMAGRDLLCIMVSHSVVESCLGAVCRDVNVRKGLAATSGLPHWLGPAPEPPRLPNPAP